MLKRLSLLSTALFALFPVVLFASESAGQAVDLTSSSVGIASIVIFAVAYLLVMTEEITHLRKSKPVILAAGLIWAIIGSYIQPDGVSLIWPKPRCVITCWNTLS